MNMKYKKFGVWTTFAILFIGMLTLSITNKTKASNDNSKQVIEDEKVAENKEGDKDKIDIEADDKEIIKVEEPEPEPAPPAIYELVKDGVPEINELMQDYYAAKINCDSDKLASLCSGKESKSVELLEAETEYIEDYRNIIVYSKKGLEEGSYIVYLYHEIKFTGVETLAPGLSKFYIVTDENNSLVISSGDIDEDIAAYNLARNEDEDVVTVIKRTQLLAEEAREKDEDLERFWGNIDKAGNEKAETPEEETPEEEAPEVETPGVETPEAETPAVETPEGETPEGEA